ncbi:MAG: hypothetical protein ACHREM_07915 [Polyangiales bacterium]
MKKMKCLKLLGQLAIAGTVLGSAREAAAEGKGKEKDVAQIATVVITARPTRPSAVVELGKILPEIEISTVRQPFLQKIEAVLMSEPF